MTRADVAVVGAGPAGSAIAAGLARRGARVVVLERSQHPRPKACAEYASPRIVEELARIGLPRDAWRDDAIALGGMEIHAGGRSVRIGYADDGGPRTAWGVDRMRFDARLAAHAAASGAEIVERAHVAGLLWRDGRTSGVRLAGDGTSARRIEADWVIGADGARSTVARLVRVERPVRFPRRLGLVAHYAGVDALRDHGEMHVGRNLYIGLAPTPAGELNVGMALPFADGERSAAARFEAAIASLPAVAGQLGAASRISPIRGAAPIGQRVARAAGPGWLLVGDAAGFVDPFTGEGIHRALRSARAATDALLAGGAVEETYRRARRHAFASKSALTWLVQAFLLAPPVLEHAIARLAERPAAALRLGSALGDLRPASDALAPGALLDVLAP